jgi:hypothetical protein
MKTDILYIVTPYTIDEIRKNCETMSDGSQWISGIVAIDLPEIIDGDLDEFLDLASSLLVGSPLLMDIETMPVEVEDGVILFRITGCVDAILESVDA